jgi:hypothetical protein
VEVRRGGGGLGGGQERWVEESWVRMLPPPLRIWIGAHGDVMVAINGAYILIALFILITLARTWIGAHGVLRELKEHRSEQGQGVGVRGGMR